MTFIESLSNFIKAIWEFVTNFIQSLVIAYQVLQTSVTFSGILSGVVFGILGSCIVIVIAVGVIKLLVGWGNV